MPTGGTNPLQGPVPILMAQSTPQASLAAANEVGLSVSLPTGFVTPSGGISGTTNPIGIATVQENFQASSCLVASIQRAAGGTSIVNVNVRNVGTLASAANWVVTVLLFGAGDCLGL